MIILFNTKIPKNKYIYFGLMFIYGLNQTKIKIILKKAGFAKTFKIFKLSSLKKKKLFLVVQKLKFLINIDLKKLNKNYISRLVDIRKYKNLKNYFQKKR